MLSSFLVKTMVIIGLGPTITTSFYLAAAAAANSIQSCPTLFDPIDGIPPGSSIHGRTLAFSSKSTGVGCHRLLRILS